MPKITVTNGPEIDASEGERLTLALRDADVDILHRCGGNAKCTTCRVEITAGEPAQMTEAERDKLQEQEKIGEYRLSCQIACNQDMTVTPLMTMESTGLDDRGPRPQDSITPEPVWVDKPE